VRTVRLAPECNYPCIPSVSLSSPVRNITCYVPMLKLAQRNLEEKHAARIQISRPDMFMSPCRSEESISPSPERADLSSTVPLSSLDCGITMEKKRNMEYKDHHTKRTGKPDLTYPESQRRNTQDTQKGNHRSLLPFRQLVHNILNLRNNGRLTLRRLPS